MEDYINNLNTNMDSINATLNDANSNINSIEQAMNIPNSTIQNVVSDIISLKEDLGESNVLGFKKAQSTRFYLMFSDY